MAAGTISEKVYYNMHRHTHIHIYCAFSKMMRKRRKKRSNEKKIVSIIKGNQRTKLFNITSHVEEATD